MGTLASELIPHAGRLAGQPRVYVDANVPARLVHYMRTHLRWDTLFILEHDDLRRASDGQHYVTARQLGRTLITLDHDYLDDRKFPLELSGGVLVFSAPGERSLMALLMRVDQELIRTAPLPLIGRKLHVDLGWSGA